MEVLITAIKDNLYVFKATGVHITDVESEFIHDDLVNKIKSWIRKKKNQDAATYCLTEENNSITMLAIVGESCSLSTFYGKEVW